MSEDQASPPGVQESYWLGSKKTALAVLFGIILLIPRLRRLRRRVWAWTVVRILSVLLGGTLLLLFARSAGGMKSLLFGMVLTAFGALVRARPQTKSVDDTTRELDALVALNGGALLGVDGTKPIRNVTIFVHTERLVVLTKARERLVEIPIATLRQVQVECGSVGPVDKKQTADLEITWGTDAGRSARFRYEGTFSEHLARVAQETIVSVSKKRLPVVAAKVKRGN